MQSIILKIVRNLYHARESTVYLSDLNIECQRYGLYFDEDRLKSILMKDNSICLSEKDLKIYTVGPEIPIRDKMIEEEIIKSLIDDVISNLISNNFKILKSSVTVSLLQAAIKTNSGLDLRYNQMIYFLYRDNYELELRSSNLFITRRKEDIKTILNSLITTKFITYKIVKDISLELGMNEFEVVINMIDNEYQFKIENDKSIEEAEKKIDEEIREYVKGETIAKEKLMEFYLDKNLLLLANDTEFESLMEKYFPKDKQISEILDICRKFHIRDYNQVDVIRNYFEGKFNPILVITTIYRKVNN